MSQERYGMEKNGTGVGYSTEWKRMVRDGKEWYGMEKNGTGWKRMVRDGKEWYLMEKNGTGVSNVSLSSVTNCIAYTLLEEIIPFLRINFKKIYAAN